jgi:hypothetical protein
MNNASEKQRQAWDDAREAKRQKVLQAFATDGGATDAEAALVTGIERKMVGTVRRGLVRAGLIESRRDGQVVRWVATGRAP